MSTESPVISETDALFQVVWVASCSAAVLGMAAAFWRPAAFPHFVAVVFSAALASGLVAGWRARPTRTRDLAAAAEENHSQPKLFSVTPHLIEVAHHGSDEVGLAVVRERTGAGTTELLAEPSVLRALQHQVLNDIFKKLLNEPALQERQLPSVDKLVDSFDELYFRRVIQRVVQRHEQTPTLTMSHKHYVDKNLGWQRHDSLGVGFEKA